LTLALTNVNVPDSSECYCIKLKEIIMIDNRSKTSNLMSIDVSMEEIYQLAEELGKNLQSSNEYQELLRLGGTLRQNEDVKNLINKIRQVENSYSGEESERELEELKRQLLALPVYQAYLNAENAARELFKTVDNTISMAAGVDFAVNAKKSGCSCGC